MCEELEQQYEALRCEYQRCIADRLPKEELAERNEVLFSAHNCGVEGNSYTVDDTRALHELGMGYVPEGKPLVETMEMLDHFHAYEHMLATLQEPMTEVYVLNLHRLLMEHTIAYRHPDAHPGEYTTMDMAAGDTLFGDHERLVSRVPDLLRRTEEAEAKGLPPMFVAAMFHGFFIYLHPFRDGNGRIGRLLSNRILLRAGHPLLIVPREAKDEYIRALKLFHKDSAEYLVTFFYQTAMRRMRGEMKEKRSNSRHISFLF